MTPNNIFVTGTGVVSPVGYDANALAQAGQRKKNLRELTSEGHRSYQCATPPDFDVSNFITSPRLRRVSPISQFAVAAAHRALTDAQIPNDPSLRRNVGVVTAVSNGSIAYTTQFHRELINQGPRAVSPMLFPETVYNAPSSHLAAVLGCDHINYTVVGDAATAFNAVALACDLIESGAVEHCLVVGAEEADWASADAYHRFGLRFTVAEGAGAIVLSKQSRPGARRLLYVDRGHPFHSRAEIATQTKRAIAEAHAATGITQFQSPASNLSLQEAVGEAFTASALWQIIAAATNLESPIPNPQLLISIGLNEQSSALILGPT